MKLNCAFMFVMSNQYGRKCLSVLILLEQYHAWCVKSDFWCNSTSYYIINTVIIAIEFVECKENELCIVVYHEQSL